MSVQNESLDLPSQQHRDEAPSLEYHSAGHDSLSMFLAAIGGAVLGVLLTLLILAIINGGTLDYTGNARVRSVEATLSRVNENLGTLSTNVDVVAAEVTHVRQALTSAEESLRQAISVQGSQVEDVDRRLTGLNESLGELEYTRKRFDTFVDALSAALAELETLDQEHTATQP